MTFDDFGELNPWDAGKLHAHQLSAYCSTSVLKCRLERAQSCRHGWLCRVLSSRKAFLDGLIDGLQRELSRRKHDHPAH